MSTLTLGTIQSNTTAPPTINNSGGTEIGTFCRAWVNFNGTGTVAIRASFNVTSITDNGVGDYTVNFTTAMSDANYSAVCTARSNSDSGSSSLILAAQRLSSTHSTTAVQIITQVVNVATDSSEVQVAIFR